MIRLFIISGLFWVLSILVYQFILKKFTFHHLNRWYLLISILLGAVLPFVPIPNGTEGPLVVYLTPIVIQLNQVTTEVVNQVQESQLNYGYILGVLYVCVALFHIVKFGNGIFALRKQARKAPFIVKNGINIVCSSEIEQPFSFWKWIFVKDEASLHPIILAHEYAHIKGGHSWDKLLIQLLAAIYWVIPVFTFYRRFINEVHEYIADDYVLQKTSKKKYSYFLLGQAGQGVTPLLSNNFHSLIKNRITMMLKKETNTFSRLWYLPVMILMLGLASVILISCDAEKEKKQDVSLEEAPLSRMVSVTDTIITFDPETYTESMEIVESQMEVFKKLDQMPLFSLEGCEGETNRERQEKCATNNMLKFIFTNIKYPLEKDQEGVVVLKFIVNSSGWASSPEIVKTIGESYSVEVLKMFNKMSDHQWIPGLQDGEKKAVELVLPIKFKLS